MSRWFSRRAPVLFLGPPNGPFFDLDPREQYSPEQTCRIDVEGAGTLAAVDIHADVTVKYRMYSDDAQSDAPMCSNWLSLAPYHYYLGSN
jgi:hypothetical protein